MVARGADLQVSAAVPVLLESTRLRGPAVQARALDGRVVPRVPRSQGAGCAAARALRWRADPARGSGGTGGRSARARALYVAHHIRLSAHQRALGGSEGGWPRPRADQPSGADAELSDAVAGTTSYRDKIAAY